MTPKPGFDYSERVLQWIWEQLLFNPRQLTTTCGKSVQIIHQGISNRTDGPDFKRAALVIDDIEWHGDVELHTLSGNWNQHGHAVDPNFNTVILHVVAEPEPAPVQCANGNIPYTLNLLPYIKAEFRPFLKNRDHTSGLPCGSGLSFISEDAFRKQITKAHQEYFDHKSDAFIHFYDPELLPSQSWKQALIISLFDGLGIPHNRGAMREIAGTLLSGMPGSLGETIQTAMQAASKAHWKLKSVRPASHPRRRVQQAARLAYWINRTDFADFLNPHPQQGWTQLLTQAKISQSGHFKILYGTVFLPALYILGNLYASDTISEAAYSAWLSLKSPIPKEVISLFNTLSVDKSDFRNKLGAVYQLRSYCKPGRCSECFVLKKAIQS